MLDIGWSEMRMIAAVAIIVIGPKEIPRTLGTIGRWVGRARSLTREFQSNVDDMIAQSEIAELKKTANLSDDFNVENILEDTASSRVDEIGLKNSTLSNQQRKREDDAGVLDNEIGDVNNRLAQSGAENIFDNAYDEANKGQGGPTDKKITAKPTET